MILPFKPQFVSPIHGGNKIHTIREDKQQRWQPGRKIHMATGVRTDRYHCFAIKHCKSVQHLCIDAYHETIGIIKDGVVMKTLSPENTLALIHNDGFDNEQAFWDWFRDCSVRMTLIHWTDKVY